ncbi:MAG TPA: MmcQ/YjbR family DNA-binding protein [Gemmatales bacterium]|nr:MmcQ/YjbR family DNA-binding protein [Gemmatales bacterium]HMP59807.1 MmcQ/YjbR family DNA-binding protein [Gemmatales bacterium]
MLQLKSMADYCRRLPGATEDNNWGNDLVFSVGGKMFACFDGVTGKQLSFKVTPEEAARLVLIPGIRPAPYLAKHHWVAVERTASLPAAAVRELLAGSHQLVVARLPKKLREQFTTSS